MNVTDDDHVAVAESLLERQTMKGSELVTVIQQRFAELVRESQARNAKKLQ